MDTKRPKKIGVQLNQLIHSVPSFFSSHPWLLWLAMAALPNERRVLVRNVKFAATKGDLRAVAEEAGCYDIIDIQITWKPLKDGSNPTWKTAFCKMPNESWLSPLCSYFFILKYMSYKKVHLF